MIVAKGLAVPLILRAILRGVILCNSVMSTVCLWIGTLFPKTPFNRYSYLIEAFVVTMCRTFIVFHFCVGYIGITVTMELQVNLDVSLIILGVTKVITDDLFKNKMHLTNQNHKHCFKCLHVIWRLSMWLLSLLYLYVLKLANFLNEMYLLRWIAFMHLEVY